MTKALQTTLSVKSTRFSFLKSHPGGRQFESASPLWPPELVVPDDWREPYAAAGGELDANLPLDVDSAADQVRDFITAIDAAERLWR